MRFLALLRGTCSVIAHDVFEWIALAGAAAWLPHIGTLL